MGLGRWVWGFETVALLVLALALPCSADVLHLKNGGRVEGKIVAEEGDRYKVEIATGVTYVAKQDVERVEYGPSPAEELRARRAALDARDPKAVLDLARWAQSKGFPDPALEIARLSDAPECRELVATLIEPAVRRGLDDARKLFRLGLLRRGREALDALTAKYPEARERAQAAVPAPRPRGRYEGFEAPDGPLETAINAYFAGGAMPATDAPLKQALAAIRRGMRGTVPQARAPVERQTPDGAPYLLRLPRPPADDRLLRLLITLHGSGGTPRSAMLSWLGSLQAEDDLLVASPDGGLFGWGNSRAGHARVLGVLRDVLANFPVDPDRICVDGASMGGHGAFFMAMYYPDRWAAIAPRVASARAINLKSSGGVPDLSPAPAILDNLWSLPVYLIAGARDPKTPIDDVRITKRRLEGLGGPFFYREYAEGEHGWFGAEDPDVLEFLRGNARDPYPARIRWVSAEPAFSRCSWIEVTRAARALRTEITHLDMRGGAVETRREYDRPVEIDAEADRGKNRITIKARGARELKVWLADELVDLDRPVEVVVNGDSAFKGGVERSLKLALEDCRRRSDRGNPFVACVTVPVR